jgi:capsular polysaccharide biosynthesis protein
MVGGGRGLMRKVQQNLKITPDAQALLSVLSLATNKTMSEVVEIALYEYARNHADEIRERLKKASEDALGAFDRLLSGGDVNGY